ncbi:MAG TPA: hypothetical protein VFW62_11860, partial [bacterium]|nr:hypothetical protein [bacterium]
MAKKKAAQNTPVKAEKEEGTNPGTPAAKLKNKPTEVASDEEVTKVAKVLPFPQQALPPDPNVEASKALADPGTSGVHKVLEGAGQDKAKVEKALEPFEAVAKAIEPNSKELAEGLRKDIEILKKGETQSPEYKEALRRTVALQTILRAEGTAHLDAQQLAHAVKHAQEGPKVDVYEERTTILPPGGSTALGVLIGAAALISPELAHAAEGAAKDISSRGGVGTTEAAIIVGIGLLLAGPTVVKKYLKKGPPPTPPVSRDNPIKLQSETKNGSLYPFSKSDMKNVGIGMKGKINIENSMVIGEKVYLSLDSHMPGDNGIQPVLPMSIEDAKRLGVVFDKQGNIQKVPGGEFVYLEGRPIGSDEHVAQAARGMDVLLAAEGTPVALKDSNGSVTQVRPLSVTESGKDAGATVSYGKAVGVDIGTGPNDPVRVKVEVYDPADPESDPRVLAFGLSKPKVLEARTFEMSRAEAIQLGILRVDKAGDPPVLAENAVLALNDEAANLHRNNRVFVPTSNEGGFTFYPAKAVGTKERIVGDIVKVDPEKTSRQGDTVYVWMRTPDLNSAGKDKLYSAEPVPMSLAEARKLGIYVSHDGKLKVVSNEFVMTPVTKEGDQVLVGGKPFSGELNEGDVSVMFRLHDGKIEMSEKEKPQALKAEILPPPSVSDVRGKKIPDALKVLGPLGVGLFAMAPDTAHAAAPQFS